MAPRGLAFDTAGNLYIADSGNNRIRMVDGKGIINTVVGVVPESYPNSILSNPTSIALDAAGNLYIADTYNNCIRKFSPSSNPALITVAGHYMGYSGDGGPASQSGLLYPQGVAIDASGNLYIADTSNWRIRKVTPDGIINTVAGNGTQAYWCDGGPATSAGISYPRGIAVDTAGAVYFQDAGNSRIRAVSQDGIIRTLALANLSNWGITIDALGSLYFTDGSCVREFRNGNVTTVAGNGTEGYSGDGGPAIYAQLGQVSGLAIDGSGGILIADSRRVRRVSPDGVITTVAGNGTSGYSGDGGTATSAQLDGTEGIAIDAAGNLYVAGQHLRKVTPNGVISTLGNGAQGAFVGGALACDRANNLYDGLAVHVYRISPSGIMSTVAGTGTTGYAGDGGLALTSQLNGTTGLALDSAGNLFVADLNNNAIRVLRPLPGPYPTVNAITHAATSLSAPLAPGEIFTLYGSGMGPAQLAPMHINAQGLADATLAETQVIFNGIPAPIVYTSDQQLAAIVPYGTKGPSADMVVTYQGHPTNPMPVLIQASSPAVFTADSTGQGQAAAINQDGTVNSPSNPAPAGTYISLYATGEGATTPAGVDGKPATAPLPKPVLPVTVTIAGQPATVQYAGAAPGLVAGVMQVNAQIPATTPPGNAPVVIQVGATKSQANVIIAVR